MSLIIQRATAKASASVALSQIGPYFLASAFMSHNQEVRVLMRPPIWSALPLFGSGTKSRIRAPAVMPKTGDTYRHKESCYTSGWQDNSVGGSHVKEQCVYTLNAWPDILYKPSGVGTLPVLTLLPPLCVWACVYIHDSKRDFRLLELLCELCTEVKPHECPSAFTVRSLSSSGLRDVLVHVCVCVRSRETKGRMGCVLEVLFE